MLTQITDTILNLDTKYRIKNEALNFCHNNLTEDIEGVL